MRWSTTLVVAAGFLIGACGSKELKGGADTAGPPTSGEVGPETPNDDTNATDPVDSHPTYASLDGELIMLAGEAQPADSLLTIGYWTGDQRLLCSTPLLLTELAAEPFDEAELPLYGWWRAALEPPADCEGFPSYPSLTLGIGAYDVRLDPAAAMAGYPPSSAYGLYVRLDDAGSVLVFGLAGTEGVFGGTEPLVTEGPLPDGRYELVGLHLLPLP